MEGGTKLVHVDYCAALAQIQKACNYSTFIQQLLQYVNC